MPQEKSRWWALLAEVVACMSKMLHLMARKDLETQMSAYHLLIGAVPGCAIPVFPCISAPPARSLIAAAGCFDDPDTVANKISLRRFMLCKRA